MDDKKIQIIVEWIAPSLIQDVQCFFEFCKLLYDLHQGLFQNCYSIDSSYRKGQICIK
jgi:hypothetical protein